MKFETEQLPRASDGRSSGKEIDAAVRAGVDAGIDAGIEPGIDDECGRDGDASAGREMTHDLREWRLFARAAEGERDAIAEVWRRNRRWIAAVLAAHAPRGTDVEDLLQEVAATLVAKCRHVRDAASLRGWLRVVAVNAARMAARSRAAERRSLRVVAERAPVAARPHAIADGTADPAELRALLARIPALYAEPLLLQSGQGLSQRQIAELLDVPETTVETRLARARRMLRRIVAEAEADDGGRTMAEDGEARRPRPIEAGDFR
ncbi:MAG: hypothetical protein RI967_766 [Planctomycetota bacterium]